MLRRDLLVELGGWDEVRVGADSELLRRLRHRQTRERVPRVLKGVPLSLALSADTTLTGKGDTHANTLLLGVRRTYYEASLHWLESNTGGPVSLPASDSGRPFPAPGPVLRNKEPVCRVTSLFIADFNQQSDARRETLSAIHSALGKGFSVGIFQWPDYRADPTLRLSSNILQLAQERDLYVVSAGERVIAEDSFVGDPTLLFGALDSMPAVSCGRVTILSSQGARLDPADRTRAARTVQRLFGIEPTWPGDAQPDE
jgi:hypothetical protein